ncbi:MAG: OadG family protein [Prolixibacteraceae bacterium]|nr:OadG family protein [Prolixibacteraceae bacterium]
MSEMGVAFELLGVGMVTVFVILALVVIIGNLIIRFVNKFIGEEVKTQSKGSSNLTVEINSKKLAAIVSVVNLVTKGTGRVSKVEKQ